MKIKKILSLILCLAFMVLIANIPVLAANAEYGMTLSDSTANVGDFVTATVYVKNMSKISAIQGTIGFNPDVLTLWDKKTDVPATNGGNGIDDSVIMGLTQLVDNEPAVAFERPINNNLDKEKGLIDFAYSAKLQDESGFLPYTVPDPKSKLTVAVLKFKVIALGDPKLKIAKESTEGYYNKVNKNGFILEEQFGSPIKGITENFEKLTIGGTIQNQDPPTGIGTEPPSNDNATDGKITGTKPGMEYKPIGSASYIPITKEEIAGLPAGTYNIRYAAKNGFYPSNSIVITVGKVALNFDSNKLTWKDTNSWSGHKIHVAKTPSDTIVFVE